MSLVRLFTRCAAIAALTADEKEPGLTFAGTSVYDSRMEPAMQAERLGELPLIGVYAEDDDYDIVNPNNPGGVFNRTISLRVEFLIGTYDTLVEGGKRSTHFVVPTTNAELEARLDMFEQQIRWALLQRLDRDATKLFLQFCKRVRSIKSTPYRDEEGGNKIAARRMMFSLETVDDCGPLYLTKAPEGEQKFDFGSFPGAPWLGDMLNAMSHQTKNHPILDVLGNARTSAIILPVLKRVGMEFGIDVEGNGEPTQFVKANWSNQI